jgi:hypothetical protein
VTQRLDNEPGGTQFRRVSDPPSAPPDRRICRSVQDFRRRRDPIPAAFSVPEQPRLRYGAPRTSRQCADGKSSRRDVAVKVCRCLYLFSLDHRPSAPPSAVDRTSEGPTRALGLRHRLHGKIKRAGHAGRNACGCGCLARAAERPAACRCEKTQPRQRTSGAEPPIPRPRPPTLMLFAEERAGFSAEARPVPDG